MKSVENGHLSRTAIILYGTETGNSQDIAGEVGQILERVHFLTDIEEFDAVTAQSLCSYNLVVFCISTTGQGDFPSNSRKFWQSLLRKKLTSHFLSSVSYALVGLCDSSYPKFNLAGRKLDKRLQQLGANPLLQPCEADEQGEDGTEGAFLAWVQLLRETLLSTYPLASGQEAIPADVRLPSKWLLKEMLDPGLNNGLHESTVTTAVEASEPKIGSMQSQPFTVALEANDRVTPRDHWQDVRLLKLHTSTPVPYMPGDALAIRPQNAYEDVEELMSLLGWQNLADTPLNFHYNREVGRNKSCPNPVFESLKVVTLRQLLTNYLDINAIPRRSFFANIAHFTDDEMQKGRALEFTDPQYLDEYFDYATRPRRSILEVLQEFHTVKVPWQEAINILPILRPRQFSIASGGEVKEGGYSFELLVAIVKYRTVIKRIREGVCTKYLAKLPVGTKLVVDLHTEGRFYAQPLTIPQTHLLIGGGTGIAPLRALIQEKLSLESKGTNTLIFGCRNASSDYFFSDEWHRLLTEWASAFNVITAFSRDQKTKVYVQDRIRENAAAVCRMLSTEDATVIVCGSSGQMPKAVRQALRDALVACNNDISDDDQAEQFLAQLEKIGRYKQETW